MELVAYLRRSKLREHNVANIQIVRILGCDKGLVQAYYVIRYIPCEDTGTRAEEFKRILLYSVWCLYVEYFSYNSGLNVFSATGEGAR